jgi:enoyl-CoA hydratase/carnithine racemase
MLRVPIFLRRLICCVLVLSRVCVCVCVCSRAARARLAAQLPGHCLGGGCIPALACDGRVMTHDKAMQFGLNECASGLVPAPWIGEAFCDALVASRRQGEGMLMRGALSSPEAALELGLVDATVPLSRLSEEAQSRLRELLSVPNAARARAKSQMRSAAADALRETLSEDLDAFVSFVASEDTQAKIAALLDEAQDGDSE